MIEIESPLRPLLNRVVVKIPEKDDTILPSGIIIPAAAKKDKEVKEGLVVAVGPGNVNGEGERIPVNVKPGDTVLFWQSNEYSRIRVDLDYYYIIKDEAIFAIVEKS